jgi:uncharacterized protein YbaR (Trm112 family)
MSLFMTVDAVCPVCQTPAKFEIVHSVNGDRRPDLRQQILDHTFQRVVCPSCGEDYRIEPEFTFVHLAKGEYLAVWPMSELVHWADVERRSAAAFDKSYGPGGSPTAAAIGRELSPRVAFGWEAAHEKLLVRDLDIDDRTLELAKVALLRTQDDLPLGPDNALRLTSVDEEQNLVFGLFPTKSATATEEMRVPRTLLDEIEAEPDWAPLREQLTAGMFVDMLRLIVEPTPVAAVAA